MPAPKWTLMLSTLRHLRFNNLPEVLIGSVRWREASDVSPVLVIFVPARGTACPVVWE
jgi:hypothetical protein